MTSATKSGNPIPQRLHDALNEQINLEFASAYIYLAMSAWCELQSLFGSAAWLRAQAQEEVQHALKFYDHILDRDGLVSFPAIAEAPATFGSLLEVFEKAYQHECFISQRIHALYALAQEVNDYASIPLLDWFVAEQVEEEKSTLDIVGQLKLVGASGDALYLVDRDLGQRGA